MQGLQALPMGRRSTGADFHKPTMTYSVFCYAEIKST